MEKNKLYSERPGGILHTEKGYSYNDVTIVPAVISSIASRKECDVYDENGMLPLFTAPMMSVVNIANNRIWQRNKINTIIPRTISYAERMHHLGYNEWVALSLREFEDVFCNVKFSIRNEKNVNPTYHVLIDLANGHMQKLYDNVNKAREIEQNNKYKLIIMVGNIANPQTYDWICRNSNIDYVRLSIGTGSGCLTTSNTGTHYPIASLIESCKVIKDNIIAHRDETIKCVPKIVADGGIRNFSDINKALALGADYVMVGSLFAGLLESAADMVIESNDPVKYPAYYDRQTGEVEYYINYDKSRMVNIWDVLETGQCSEENKQELIRSMKNITKKYIGMSTKEAQIAINAALKNPIIADKKDLKTSEGCTKFIPVKYTIAQWVENMIDYLRSAMSYADARTLEEFRNNTYLIVNSPYAVASVNK